MRFWGLKGREADAEVGEKDVFEGEWGPEHHVPITTGGA
jgi:hypothetical protein